MAAMKANGKLKSYLSGCTYGEAVSRISQVARDQDFTALKELQLCREDHKNVGLKRGEGVTTSWSSISHPPLLFQQRLSCRPRLFGIASAAVAHAGRGGGCP
jgi:hypothetical protein